MIVEPDDSVVIAGIAGADATDSKLYAAKLTSSGALDQSFGTAGVTVAPIPSGYALEVLGGAASLGGSLYVAGVAIASNPDVRTQIVWKLSATGVPDQVYGPSGLSSGVAPTNEAVLGVQGSDLVTAGIDGTVGDGSLSSFLVVERLLP